MAETVTCTGCGGVVPMTALAAAVTCPYCQRQLQLSPNELGALQAYRAHVEGQLARAREQQTYAEGWNRWYGGRDAKKKNNPLIALFLWLGIIVSISILGVLTQVLGIAEQAAKVMPFAIMGILVVAVGGYMYWFYSGRTKSTSSTRLVAADVHCPACGAPHQLQPGEVLQRCRFCSAPLMPDQAVMEHGRAEVERALLRAEIERGRAERRGMTMLSSSSAANYQAYIVVGSFLPVTGGSAIAFTVSFLMGEERDTSIGGVFALWAVASVNAGILALVYGFRTHRQEGFAAVSRALLTRFGGASLADQWAMNGWLDRHWAGLVPIEQLFRGPYFSATAFTLEGFPMLLVLNPIGAAEQYKGFVTVRLSAWLAEPDAVGSHPGIATAKRGIHALGGSLEVTRAGFCVHFPKKAARNIAKPASVPALADVMAQLASAARQLDVKPVDIP